MKQAVIKIVVGGDGGVGKTTYLHKYCSDVFLTDTKLTVGVDFLTKKMQKGEYLLNLALWDFGGQEQFRFILKSYVCGARAGILFFALDRIQSFMNLDEWASILRSEKEDLPLVLVGTKADLEDEDMKIPQEDIDEFIKKHDILQYFRTSSKTGENISAPIETLADYFHKKFQED